MMCKSPSNIKMTSKKYSARGAGIAAVPCGMCKNCRINQSRIWVNRILLETLDHGDSVFLSLTYDDQHLPDPPHVNKIHLVNYIRRLRYHVRPIKIRYFGVGEYGNEGTRVFNPHYHCIIFGLGLLNYRVLKECWEHSDSEEYGVQIGEVNKDTARYITGYIVKKIDKTPGRELHPVNFGLKDEFMISSRKGGGIGANRIRLIAERLKDEPNFEKRPMSQINRGKKMMPIGRYLSGILNSELGIDRASVLENFWLNQELHFLDRDHCKINRRECEQKKRGTL